MPISPATKAAISSLSSRSGRLPTALMSGSYSSTFESLVADLTRDATRAQPRDALQYCADWFNSRLHEQRARIRDIFEQSPALNGAISSRQSRGHSAPEGLFRDTGRMSRLSSEVRPSTSMPQVVPPPQKQAGPPALGPFGAHNILFIIPTSAHICLRRTRLNIQMRCLRTAQFPCHPMSYPNPT